MSYPYPDNVKPPNSLEGIDPVSEQVARWNLHDGKPEDEGEDAPPGDVRFLQVLDELEAMHTRKQADYGREEDPYANVRASVDFGIEPWIGALVRGNDKVRRLQTAALQKLQDGAVNLSNEGVRDSLLDLAVYAIIATVLYDEEHEA